APSVTTTKTTADAGQPATSTGTAVEPTGTTLDPRLPKVITPYGGMPDAPQDMILVRLGFKHELNYVFVVENPVSVAQIFEYVPKGLNFGLNTASVTMHSLQPYDTRKSKGYVTTLVLAYIPKDLFDELDLQRRTPGSRMMNNPTTPIEQIMALLDSTIPLRASASEQDGNGNGQLTDDKSWTDDDSTTTTTGGGGSPIENKTGPISTKTVGIGAGVCFGALAYGGAMFFVARRYRQKRKGHSRSSSVQGAMVIGGPTGVVHSSGIGAMMHGARDTYGTQGSTPGGLGAAGAAGAPERNSHGSGPGGRGPQISAPLMAANSLGWN
ncbi:hypothetical protein BZA05DRAFT_335164, partial [Tricharina praecox]|uniref:uncharacterized protein n=1 Tax=Tricharina praecox TaxID=43433 RepID=UPI00221FF108